MTPYHLQMAYAVIEELLGRSGFDAWWSIIPDDTQDEILETLAKVLAEGGE